MEAGYFKPTEVVVRDGLDRYRKDMGGIKELAESLQEFGQIQPILITRDMELVAGGRRLAACIFAGIDVFCCFRDSVTDLELRELEVEENLRRKCFTPAEEACAIRDLHNLKVARKGEAGSGSKSEGDTSHSMTDTAKIIGKSRHRVKEALEMADLIDKFPQLKQAKSKSEIKKAGKAIQKLTATMAGLEKNKEITSNGNQLYEVHRGDAIEHMLSRPNGSIDILLTDPLYGIEADKLMQSVGGSTGGAFTSSGYKIDDSTDKAMLSYEVLARESYRFTTPTAHGFIFVGPEYFWTLRKVFMDAGWGVHVKPIIWIKRETGQCNIPYAWPSSCYEMLMYCRKTGSRLVQEGKPDWVEFPIVNPSDRRHSYEKPVGLIKLLLERVSLPGQIVYDPFAGSGSTLEAATRLNLRSIGVEIDTSAYANILERLSLIK